MLKVGDLWEVGQVNVQTGNPFLSPKKWKVVNTLLEAGVSLEIIVAGGSLGALRELKPLVNVEVYLKVTPETLSALEKNVKGSQQFSSGLYNENRMPDLPFLESLTIDPGDDVAAVITKSAQDFNDKLSKKTSSRKGFKSGNFFHVSHYDYEPGDIIDGSWKGSDYFGYGYNIGEAVESFLEEARPSGAVSRLKSVFAFENYADAAEYRDDLRPGGKIYVVEIIGNSTRADMHIVDDIAVLISELSERPDGDEESEGYLHLKETMNKTIESYWNGKPSQDGGTPMWERICEKIKVVEAVELKEGMVLMSLKTLREIVRSGI